MIYTKANFIGKYCRARYINDLYHKPIEGKVVDETKNMFYIQQHNGKIKKIIKKNAVFEFEIEGKFIKILGNTLIGRPEERVKKKIKQIRSFW